MMNEPIHTIMTKNLVTVSPSTKLSVVHYLLKNHRIHHLPVVDEETNQLEGIITTYDLFCDDRQLDQYYNIPVSHLMTRKIVKLESTDKVGTAAELFLSNNFHAIPIVDQGILVGLVTTFDVLKYEFIKEYPKPILYKEVFEQSSDVAGVAAAAR